MTFSNTRYSGIILLDVGFQLSRVKQKICSIFLHKILKSIEVNQSFTASFSEFAPVDFFSFPGDGVIFVFLDLFEEFEFGQRQVGIIKFTIIQHLVNLFLELCFLGLHLAVPVIFDGVVGSSREVARDLGPLVTVSLNR